MRAYLLGIALLGCTPRSADEGATKHSGEAPSSEDDASAGEQPKDPSYAIVEKICTSPCAGGFATIQVFRDAEGRAARLRYDGDLQSCSHPPRIYFDAEGNETLAVAERPVVAGSPEAEALAAGQAAQTKGLREAELLTCTEPGFCEPARIEGFVSSFTCRSGADCMTCECGPVDRAEFARRGGTDACVINGEECTATNPVCCAGKCALAR